MINLLFFSIFWSHLTWTSFNKQIPADMVVNAILVAAVAHANRPSADEVIYHVGSSVRKPVRYSNIQDYGLRYFTAKPWINKDGRPVKVGKVTVLHNMDSFRRYMFLRYLLVLKVKVLVLIIINISPSLKFHRNFYNDKSLHSFCICRDLS